MSVVQEFSEVFTVQIEVWVSRRDDSFVKHFADPDDKPFRANVRHSNGVLEWQWCDTFEEAVEWCRRFQRTVFMLP